MMHDSATAATRAEGEAAASPPAAPGEDRLLTTAKRMLVGLTVFFFLASLAQLGYLHTRIADTPDLEVQRVVGQRIDRAPSDQALLPLIELETRAVLEELALKRRYHQANVLLMSRIWVSYLSFVTGMILSLVGASFILGRIREPVTNVDAQTPVARVALSSSSPGIVLAALGAFLIASSILTNHRIAVEDRSVYLPALTSPPAAPPALPRDLEEAVDPDNPAQQALDDLLQPQRQE